MNPPRAVLDYKRMKGYGGKEFDGESTDPQVAVDWIRDMNAVFDQLEATSDERLRYCVFLLRGHARTWWEATIVYEEDPFSLGWEEFQIRFDAEFITDQWKEEKAMEFMSLKQGDMTVQKYHIEFTRLSRWHHTIPSERNTILKKHFLAGFRTNIQKGISSSDMANWKDIKQAALRAEYLDNKEKKEWEENKEDLKRKAVSQNVSYSGQGPMAKRGPTRMSY